MPIDYKFIQREDSWSEQRSFRLAIESGGNPGFRARPARAGLVLRSSGRMIVSSTDWPQSLHCEIIKGQVGATSTVRLVD